MRLSPGCAPCHRRNDRSLRAPASATLARPGPSNRPTPSDEAAQPAPGSIPGAVLLQRRHALLMAKTHSAAIESAFGFASRSTPHRGMVAHGSRIAPRRRINQCCLDCCDARSTSEWGPIADVPAPICEACSTPVSRHCLRGYESAPYITTTLVPTGTRLKRSMTSALRKRMQPDDTSVPMVQGSLEP